MSSINKSFSWYRLQEIQLLWFHRTWFSIAYILKFDSVCYTVQNDLISFVVSDNLSYSLYLSTFTELFSSRNTTWFDHLIESYLFLWYNSLLSLRIRVKARNHRDRLHIPICNRRLQRFRITIRFDTRMHHKPLRLVLMLGNHLHRRNIHKLFHLCHMYDLVWFAFFLNAFLILPALIATNIIYTQLNHKLL